MIEPVNMSSNTNAEVLFTLTDEQFNRLTTVLDQVPSDVVPSKMLRYPAQNIDSPQFNAILQFFMHHSVRLPYQVDLVNTVKSQYTAFAEALDRFDTFEDIIASAQETFIKSNISFTYLSERIDRLRLMAEEDDETSVSLPSLRGLFLFLFTLQEYDKPQITLNDKGLFQVNWRQTRDNALTVNFKDAQIANYVLFRPSRHTDKRTILNGIMSIFDLRDYLAELQVQVYKATEDNAAS